MEGEDILGSHKFVSSKNYEQGRRYEYEEIKYWTKKGYFSHRRWGSIGVYDVLATNGKETIFIQVKSFRTRVRGTYQADIKRLKEIPRGTGVRRILVVYGPIRAGLKTPRKEQEV